MNLLADYLPALVKNEDVATLEGGLVRKWREFFDITQVELGRSCVPEMGKNGVYRIEKGESSLSIDTLLKIVQALESVRRGQVGGDFSFGADDAEKLSRFFQGPKVRSELERVDGAVRSYLSARRRTRPQQ